MDQKKYTRRSPGNVRRWLALSAVALTSMSLAGASSTLDRRRGRRAFQMTDTFHSEPTMSHNESPRIPNIFEPESLQAQTSQSSGLFSFVSAAEATKMGAASDAAGEGKGGKGGKGSGLFDEESNNGKAGKGSTKHPKGGCDGSHKSHRHCNPTASPYPTSTPYPSKSPGKGGKGGKGHSKGDCDGSHKSHRHCNPTASPYPTVTPKNDPVSPTMVPAPNDATLIPTNSPNDTPPTPPTPPTIPSTPSPTNGTPTTIPSAPSPTGRNSPALTDSPTPADTTPDGNYVERDCDAIREGTASTDTEFFKIKVGMELTIDDAYDTASVLEQLQVKLQQVVAPIVAGCKDEDFVRRILQATEIVNVLFGELTTPGGKCDQPVFTNSASTCSPTDTEVSFYYNEGAELDTNYGELLVETINNVDLEVDGLLNTRAVTAVTVTDGVTDGSNDNLQRKDGISTGGLLGIGAGTVAVLAAVLLFAHKRRNNTDMHHAYLDDDGSYTGAKDIGSDTATEVPSEPSTPSRSYMVDDDGSIAAAWGNGIPHEASYEQIGLCHSGMDVHHCNSATCNLCDEAARNRDLQFVPTGVLPASSRSTRMPRMPRHSARDYMSHDTVDL